MLHPATILPAVQKNIPVLVLNSRNPENEGTRIISLAPHCESPFKSIAVKKRLTNVGFEAFSSSPEELGETIRVQLERWGKMVADAGIKRR